jgi:subtilisin family serine protease
METEMIRRGLLGLVLLLLGAVALPGALVYSNNNHHVYYEPHQIVVKLAADSAIEDINATYGTTTIRALLNSAGVYLLQLPAAGNALSFKQQMAGDPRLHYAELNIIGSAPEALGADIYAWPEGSAGNTGSAQGADIYAWPEGNSGNTGNAQGADIYAWPEGSTGNAQGADIYAWPESDNPDDGDFYTQTSPIERYDWELGDYSNERYLNQPAVQAVKLSRAHAISQGAGVIVAVLDTGVDLYHPWLASHLTAVRYDFIDENEWPLDVGNGLDDDGDGYIDEVVGHGTHVAGIIRLVAPQAQIMPLRVLNSDGQGNIFVVAEAMLYAAHHGAQVINLSLGTPESSQVLNDVVAQLEAEGIVVVGAAGNLNRDLAQYPAATECALSVTAVGPGVIKSRFASYGTWVDLAAPGIRIYSTYPNNQYSWWSGTSMATPFVSGQVALLRSANPDLSLSQIGHIIAATVKPLDQQNHRYSGQLGAGRIDIGASLEYLHNGQWGNGVSTLMAGCGH